MEDVLSELQLDDAAFEPLNEITDFSAVEYDDDLAAVLLSLGGDNLEEFESHEDEGPAESEPEEVEAPTNPLPDIEVDFGDDNDNEFLDSDLLGKVFEDVNQETQENPHGSEIEDQSRIDQETEDLYTELANLTLGDDSADSSDGLPSYLFCQPCSSDEDPFLPPNQLLPSITEDAPLSEQDLAAFDARESSLSGQIKDSDEDELLRLSFLTLDDDGDDDLIAEMDLKYSEQEALEEAAPLLDAFGIAGNKSKERSCFGHKETIFGVTFSDCGKYCATASQDSSIKVWDVETNTLLSTLNDHSKDFECLRVAWATSGWANDELDRSDLVHLLATSGADGIVRVWSCRNPRDGWTCRATLDHAKLLGRPEKKPSTDDSNEKKEEEEPDKPQVYSLQFIEHWRAFTIEHANQAKNSFLMTSSDDYVHLWEASIRPAEQKIQLIEDGNSIAPDVISLTEVMSVHFGELDQYGYGVTACNLTDSGLQISSSGTQPAKKRKGFGGDRNPNNLIFVFDASYCSANGLLGVALSDGSMRLVNGRGVCVSILNLPGCQSHLTSFCWDSTGSRLATTVATGHLITWHLDIGDVQGRGNTVATCTGIMEGGHQFGRPLFGARYCGSNEKCLVSWGVDGSLCLWDSYSQGNVNAPLAVLKQDSEYPIYAVEVAKNCIAVGGGSEGGFVGIPLFLYTYELDRKTDLSKAGNSDEESKTLESPSEETEDKTGPVVRDPNIVLPNEKVDAPPEQEAEKRMKISLRGEQADAALAKDETEKSTS